MARHPESQECIREELAARYMQSNNGELTVADLDSMTYTQAALKVPFFFAPFSFQQSQGVGWLRNLCVCTPSFGASVEWRVEMT